MDTYQWLCLLGVPSMLAGLFLFVKKQLERARKETACIKSGVQALLRAEMISEWNKYKEKGYAPLYAKESFENLWKQYHALGANGVMDSIHKEFLMLSDKPLQAKNSSNSIPSESMKGEKSD